MEQSDISFEKYYTDVFRFLRGLSRDEFLAEELTQETFYRAIKSKDTFQGNSDIRVWLCSIAKNLFYTHYKNQKRVEYGEDWKYEYEQQEQEFLQIMEDKETALELHKILHTLREPYKEIFALRIFGELSFKEIAELFDKSEHWACVTYHRAKAMLQGEMRKKGDFYEDRM